MSVCFPLSENWHTTFHCTVLWVVTLCVTGLEEVNGIRVTFHFNSTLKFHIAEVFGVFYFSVFFVSIFYYLCFLLFLPFVSLLSILALCSLCVVCASMCMLLLYVQLVVARKYQIA